MKHAQTGRGRLSRQLQLPSLIVAAAALLLPAAIGQHPLPADMLATFDHTWAEQITLPLNPAVGKVRARFTFDNKDDHKTIKATYAFQTSGAEGIVESRDYTLAFKPTAICHAGPKSDHFFVMGWAERSGMVVIEEWTLEQYALGSTVTPAGNEISVLAGPSITKELIFAGGGLGPILGGGYDPYNGKLYLLERGAVRAVRVLDVPTGQLESQPVITEQTCPALSLHRSLSIGVSSVFGVIVFSERRARWELPTAYDEPYIACVMKDSDKNGTIDVIESPSFTDFSASTSGTWLLAYP